MSLRNPEREWMCGPPATIDRDEVERRIGPTGDTLEVLTGGLTNLNIRVGRDRVLRIFRDARVVGKEVALAARDWRALRAPKVLARGLDFLVYEYIEHTPLSEAHGADVGRALAEIHAVTFAATGYLGDELALLRPPEWGPYAHDRFTPAVYASARALRG